MAARTHRIHVDVTFTERKRIAKLARKAGISISEFARQAVMTYSTAQEEAVLEKMLALLNRSTARANTVVDEALASVDASNKRIKEMNQPGPAV